MYYVIIYNNIHYIIYSKSVEKWYNYRTIILKVSARVTLRLTQIGPRGGVPPLDISGCLTTLVSLRHVIWISHSSASFGEAIRHKIYGIQGLFFRKLGLENA